MITKDDVIGIAKQCFDPEIPVNIWDLGLIYEINISEDGKKVAIEMSLTSQHCPAAQSIPNSLQNKIKTDLKVSEVEVKVVFDPVWTPERITEEGKKKLGIDV